jgi:CheY-like chemotaxis protein
VARILVVDDDVAVSGTYLRMLQVSGHDGSAVVDAAQGLDVLRSSRPDALLVDMRMPGLSGLEFLRRLRADPANQGLPVGIVTGVFVEDEEAREIESLGAVLKHKPIWLDDMSALLDRLLPPQTDAAGSLAPIS